MATVPNMPASSTAAPVQTPSRQCGTIMDAAMAAIKQPKPSRPGSMASSKPSSDTTDRPSGIDSGYASVDSTPTVTPNPPHTNYRPSDDLDLPAHQSPDTQLSSARVAQTPGHFTPPPSPTNLRSIVPSTPLIVPSTPRILPLDSRTSLWLRTATKLRVFDKPISQAAVNRFNDLHQLFEERLFNHVFRKGVSFTAISMKLKVLGECEEKAIPWVIVLCDKSISKRVKHFFNQPSVKDEFRPSEPDSSFPVFNVYVLERSPREMAGSLINVYGRYFDHLRGLRGRTLCGTAIRVDDANTGREATVGGIIEVGWDDGRSMLYGLTAGHVFAPPKNDKAELEDTQEDENSDSDEEFMDEASFELDFRPCLEEDQSHSGNKSWMENFPMLHRLLKQGPSTWFRFGHVSAAASEIRTKQNLDWGLIELVDQSLYKPNLLTRARPKAYLSFFENDELVSAPSSALDTGEDRTVLLLDKSGDRREGILKCSRSCIMVAPGESFVTTHDLVLPVGSGLRPGDCGAWVVDPYSNMVYGHVIASDALGDAYVVPLQATFQDIKEKLGASFVRLPDLRRFNALRSQKSAKPRWRNVRHSVDLSQHTKGAVQGIDSGYSSAHGSPPPLPTFTT